MCWSMESQKYVKAAIDTIRSLLLEDGQELKGEHDNRHHGRSCLAIDQSWTKLLAVTKTLHPATSKSLVSSDRPLSWDVLTY